MNFFLNMNRCFLLVFYGFETGFCSITILLIVYCQYFALNWLLVNWHLTDFLVSVSISILQLLIFVTYKLIVMHVLVSYRFLSVHFMINSIYIVLSFLLCFWTYGCTLTELVWSVLQRSGRLNLPVRPFLPEQQRHWPG